MRTLCEFRRPNGVVEVTVRTMCEFERFARSDC